MRSRQNGCHFTDNLFKYISLNENFKQNLTEKKLFRGSNWQYGSIGSDNGLAPNRQKAIIVSTVGMLYWCIYASLGLNELRIGDMMVVEN